MTFDAAIPRKYSLGNNLLWFALVAVTTGLVALAVYTACSPPDPNATPTQIEFGGPFCMLATLIGTFLLVRLRRRLGLVHAAFATGLMVARGIQVAQVTPELALASAITTGLLFVVFYLFCCLVITA